MKGAIGVIQYEMHHLVAMGLYRSDYFDLSIAPTEKWNGPYDDGTVAIFGGALQNAMLESFLVHARNLIDFFMVPGGRVHADDIVASDFFDDPSTWPPPPSPVLGVVRERIHKKLAHPSYHRLDDHDGWNPRAIVQDLMELRDRFNELNPAWLLSAGINSLAAAPAAGRSPNAKGPS